MKPFQEMGLDTVDPQMKSVSQELPSSGSTQERQGSLFRGQKSGFSSLSLLYSVFHLKYSGLLIPLSKTA